MDRLPLIAAVPLTVAAVWYLAAPAVVAAGNPRMKQRNPDHFGRLVRFSRLWGLAAVAAGMAVAFIR